MDEVVETTEVLYPNVDPLDHIYQHHHVLNYFDNDVYNRILNLSSEDKHKYFHMIMDYSDILIKILDDVNHPIFNHVHANPFHVAEIKSQNNPNDSIIPHDVNYDNAKQLLDAFNNWKSNL